MTTKKISKKVSENKISSYEDIAVEYYNEVRHPTCANFREASSYIINRWLKEIDTNNIIICEVGAGKSIIAETLSLQSKIYKKLYITDFSETMLSYSKQFANEKTELKVCSVVDLPFDSESIDLIVSSLGDPYNTFEFWHETSRVLGKNGKIIFTSPSFDWATKFRRKNNEKLDSAKFDLSNGKSILVPSFIMSIDDQYDMIHKAGMTVLEYESVLLTTILPQNISPKLLVDNNISIVEGYLISKNNFKK